MIELGTLTEVDLREVWSDEARDFTPWLKENIERLNQVLGLGLRPYLSSFPNLMNDRRALSVPEL